MKRTLLALAVFASSLSAAEPDKFDQSGIPLEVEPTDPALAKIVIVAGKVSNPKSGEHEYFAGSVVLAKLLRRTPGVFPVLARDGWPKNPKIFENAKAIVLFMDGGGSQAFLAKDKWELLEAQLKKGCGLVHLHQVIDYPRAGGAQMIPWIGGAWDKEIGCRGHWVGACKDFPVHPITRGVGPFEIDDGWIFNIRFIPEMRGVTPLLKVVPPEKMRTTADAKKYPGRAEIMAWTFDRDDGGRAFTFVGAHLHSSLAKPDYRRFLINGILWSAKVEVPANGADVEFDVAELPRHFDKKPLPKAAPKAKAKTD